MSIMLPMYDMQRVRGLIGPTTMLYMSTLKTEIGGVSFGHLEGMD